MQIKRQITRGKNHQPQNDEPICIGVDIFGDPIYQPEPEKPKPRPFTRKARERDASPAKIIAYDFETTRIEKGTPRPLYLTAYGENPALAVETRIKSMNHLRSVLETYFLTIDLSGVKFVAWNANNFDAYFVAAALVTDTRYTIRPYLTRSNALRGMRVMLTEFIEASGDYMKGAPTWEFLDGMAMLGLIGVSLSKFLDNFAPEHRKITGAINFETETFDYKNRKHCEYAMRDSEGLYHGMVAAQAILLERFNQPLTVTMGGACIKILQANIPPDVVIYAPPPELENAIRSQAMRGGYCYCVRRYEGPVWKYDLNQAYAAAMREAKLPCGTVLHHDDFLPKSATVYFARVTASNPENQIPFYYRNEIGGRVKAVFGATRIDDSWLTSIEVDQLKREGWQIKIHESWVYPEHFSLREYVDSLECLRTTCEGGPSGPIGTMAKMVGNHSYGKTVEQLEPVDYMLSGDAPPGFEPFYADGFEPLDHVFYRMQDVESIVPKEYHQPQLGAFITAHVRMVLRRAALLAPDAWLYADTDCAVFSRDVTAMLDTDAKRYGAWKIEETGAVYQIIAKKVYVNKATGKGSAKGMNVKKLTVQDFDDWYHGIPPVQDQVQRNNFIAVMRGLDMYRNQRRSGTAVEKTVL